MGLDRNANQSIAISLVYEEQVIHAYAHVYEDEHEITEDVPELAFYWYRHSNDHGGDEKWNMSAAHRGVNHIAIPKNDINGSWLLECVCNEAAIYGNFLIDNAELIQDIGKAYQNVIKQFYDAGCRNLQLDDCTWGALVGDAAKQRYASLGIDLEDVKEQLLKVNNLALEGKPEDMVINSHICRGNYHSTYFTSGPYDSVADYVFARENVNALFLEYDDERSGGFVPLAKVSDDKKVVLGLITTKSPVLEDKQKIIKRIHAAAQYIPLSRLCLSPQCGFASCEIGNKLTEEEQWAKLKLVKEIADEVWGE